MRPRSFVSVVPVLLAFGLFGCDAEQRLTAPAPVALHHVDAAGEAAKAGGGHKSGAVYVLTNSAAGNAVLEFARDANGTLAVPRSFATGGLGTGASLGNQGGLAFEEGGRRLFAVNAGSNEITAFRVDEQGLVVSDRVAAGGVLPISVAVHHDLVYVLDAGGTGNVQGFRVSPRGELRAIPGAHRPLGGAAVGPAQIGVTPDGRHVIVTEKATNQIAVYDVRGDGALDGPTLAASSGTTPFGFGFDRRGTLVVSEAFGGMAGASAVSSYRIARDGALELRSGSVPTTQTAACWIAVTPDNRHAYTTNAGSASVTGYTVAGDGTLARLGGGITAGTGGGPAEMALTRNGRFLYVLEGGAHAVGAYTVAADGSLAALGDTPGLPPGLAGIAAR